MLEDRSMSLLRTRPSTTMQSIRLTAFLAVGVYGHLQVRPLGRMLLLNDGGSYVQISL